MALAERDHATTLAQLERLEADHGVRLGDLTVRPGFEAFVESPEFAAWTERQRAAPDAGLR